MDKQLPVSVWPEWKITEKIGEGSFGKVYKACRSEQGTTFYSAIKVITIPSNPGELSSVRSESPNEQSVKEYFQGLVDECIQEVSTMEYFRGNSHVVSVEDYKVVEYLDDIGWDIFIRMEYLTSFMEYCAEKPLKEEDVIRLGIDLCKALEYCQCQNIIHRDIKPENIVITPGGEAVFIDFGTMRSYKKDGSRDTFVVGTRGTAAPEQYGYTQTDQRTDVYAIGQTMLYMVSESYEMDQLSECNVSRKLKKVIEKACSFEPNKRYTDASELSRAIEKCQKNSRKIL